MEDTFIRNIDGSFSKAVVGSDHTVVGCTLPLNDGLSIEVGEAEPTTIVETTPETSRWIGRDVYALIRACDEALNWADENARWFDISTAPKEEGVSFLVTTEVRSHLRRWTETHVVYLNEDGDIHPDCHQGWCLRDYTHWRPLPPPPSNPPLPKPLNDLGAVLRKVKGVN